MEKPYQQIDKKLKQTKKQYKIVEQEFSDDLITVFDELNTLNNETISMDTKKRLKRKYERYEGNEELVLLYLAYLMSKKPFGIEQIAEIEILIQYDTLFGKYKSINKNVFSEFVKNGYNNCLKDIKKKETTKTFLNIVDNLLNKTSNGSTYNSYMSGTLVNNAQQLKRQVVTNLYNKKQLDIKDFEKMLEKQQNQMLKTKDNKFSGFIEYQAERMYNEGYKQACTDEGIEKVLFIGVEDVRQTEMCKSLTGKEFYVTKSNTFTRYFESKGGEDTITVKGLQEGINLPPITDNFHYCRSYIEAII